VFISDVHLGSRHCHAAELAEFLSRSALQAALPVGDIVDLVDAQRRASWGCRAEPRGGSAACLRRAGTEIVYPGQPRPADP
jgi:UDP-2,3-diacylglucosamine pyrophosphatase LpxH